MKADQCRAFESPKGFLWSLILKDLRRVRQTKNEEVVRCSKTMDMPHEEVGQSLKCFGNTVVPHDGAQGPAGCEGKRPADAGRSQSWRA